MAITTYKVVSGDTLFKIGQKVGMTVSEIKSLNGLVTDNLKVGQVLQVRTQGGTQPQTTPSTPPATGGSTQPYRVVAGDTLYKISQKFGMSVDEIKALNGLSSNNLSVGQLLMVRGQGGGGGSVPVVTPPPPPPPPPPVTGGNYLAARQQFQYSVRQDFDCQRYSLSVPLTNGSVIRAELRDNVKSRFMVYPNGLIYGGQSHVMLDLATIQSVGLTPKQAKALQYVSVHEGSFDAINGYDKAIFSYGFIQFTGAAAVGASLNRVMASMEANAPVAFQNIFKRVGIDTEGFGKEAVVTVLDDSGFKRRGDEAWLYIQRNVPLHGAFIQAGYEPSLIREQLRMANDLYVQPALNFKLNLTVGGIHIQIPRLNDMLTSEAALTAVIALAINQGTGGMSQIVAQAASQVATRQRLTNAAALRQIDEREVIQTIAGTTVDERVLNRVNGVLFDTTLSFAKA